jgi:hypothetical protein
MSKSLAAAAAGGRNSRDISDWSGLTPADIIRITLTEGQQASAAALRRAREARAHIEGTIVGDLDLDVEESEAKTTEHLGDRSASSELETIEPDCDAETPISAAAGDSISRDISDWSWIDALKIPEIEGSKGADAALQRFGRAREACEAEASAHVDGFELSNLEVGAGESDAETIEAPGDLDAATEADSVVAPRSTIDPSHVRRGGTKGAPHCFGSPLFFEPHHAHCAGCRSRSRCGPQAEQQAKQLMPGIPVPVAYGTSASRRACAR